MEDHRNKVPNPSKSTPVNYQQITSKITRECPYEPLAAVFAPPLGCHGPWGSLVHIDSARSASSHWVPWVHGRTELRTTVRIVAEMAAESGQAHGTPSGGRYSRERLAGEVISYLGIP